MDSITYRLGDIIPSSPSASSRSTASSYMVHKMEIQTQGQNSRDPERDNVKILSQKDICDTSHAYRPACICRPERHPLSGTAIKALDRFLLARCSSVQDSAAH